MKIEDLTVDGDFTVDDELIVKGNITMHTDNGYSITFSSSPNWFQRLLYKLLGCKVEKNGNT